MTEIEFEDIGKAAKAAALQVALATTAQKDLFLVTLADLLRREGGTVLEANRHDVAQAKANGMSDAMLDRLSLQGRLEGIANDVEAVAALPDPIGEVLEEKTMPNGIQLSRQRTPIGVLGVIYEARPNVTIDVATLAIKSGNAVILRGGAEAIATNYALVKLVHKALQHAQLPVEATCFIADPDRQWVLRLLRMHAYVDLIIPRGGNSLHTFCRENSTIPVITGGIGICHLYVDQTASIPDSVPVIDNAKTQRPTVCNALDTLLVHERVAEELLPRLMAALEAKGVAFCVAPEALSLFERLAPAGFHGYRTAEPTDWDTEWLGLTLGVRVVASLDEALQHIRQHSSGHSDGILTQDPQAAERFVREVDSAAVYVNASTRFTDGGQFGLGAEVAISTQKLHARGPMGLRELTSYKWVVRGNYHTRP